MPDMLVKLYELPDERPYLEKMKEHGIVIRRAIAPEKRLVVGFARDRFNPAWGDECEVAFSRLPVSCWIAHTSEELVGFACYDSIQKGFFGPTGVLPSQRGKGVGAALLVLSLKAMYAEGYAYGVIGGAGPTEFYEKIVGATVIEGSAPGVYRHMLKE